MGVNICHFIHHTIHTPLPGEKLRADCLYDYSEENRNANAMDQYARNQIEVSVHGIQHDEIEIVAEIPEQITHCRDKHGDKL